MIGHPTRAELIGFPRTLRAVALAFRNTGDSRLLASPILLFPSLILFLPFFFFFFFFFFDAP